MRKNMSLCRRVVGTSLLAITLLGMSSVGVNKVAA
ncbi:cell surface-anchored protein, partial [Streptococcus canis]